MDLYKEILVWRRLNYQTAIRYRCLHDLETDKYTVSNADGFQAGDNEHHYSYLENLFVELLTETSPTERCDWFDEIGDAIAHHDREFDLRQTDLPSKH